MDHGDRIRWAGGYAKPTPDATIFADSRMIIFHLHSFNLAALKAAFTSGTNLHVNLSVIIRSLGKPLVLPVRLTVSDF
jgi:hypothetical protein